MNEKSKQPAIIVAALSFVAFVCRLTNLTSGGIDGLLFGLIEKRFVLAEDSVNSLKKTCSLAPFPIIRIFTL